VRIVASRSRARERRAAADDEGLGLGLRHLDLFFGARRQHARPLAGALGREHEAPALLAQPERVPPEAQGPVGRVEEVVGLNARRARRRASRAGERLERRWPVDAELELHLASAARRRHT
jgi:hypothetical protein